LKYRYLIKEFRTKNNAINYSVPRLNDLLERDKNTKRKLQKIDSINLYSNIEIKHNLILDTGITGVLQMDPRSKIDPQKSKKLIYGSLVCLSSDHFDRELLIGTIEGRSHNNDRNNSNNPNKNEKENENMILINFENYSAINLETSIVNNNLNSPLYTMIETSAFFESYKHVLQALKTFNRKQTEFPFKEYLVFNQTKDLKIPKYLKGVTIDFRFILLL
jgi:hypothetical protein